MVEAMSLTPLEGTYLGQAPWGLSPQCKAPAEVCLGRGFSPKGWSQLHLGSCHVGWGQPASSLLIQLATPRASNPVGTKLTSLHGDELVHPQAVLQNPD